MPRDDVLVESNSIYIKDKSIKDKAVKKERNARVLQEETSLVQTTVDTAEEDDRVKSLLVMMKNTKDACWETQTADPNLKSFVTNDPVPIPEKQMGHTKKFQKYFANGVSLKKDIAQKIKMVKGVESVGVGFSTERNGYWPVIRVLADEETCKEMKQDKTRKTTLIQGVTAELKEALMQLHPTTSWDEDELKNTIEIVIKYPLQAYELCSAGEVVETSYSFHDKVTNQRDTRNGTMGYCVCHEVTIGDDEPYTSHYEITAHHPLIPSHSTHFQQTLPPLPTTDTTLDTSVKYKYIRQCSDTDDVALTTSLPEDHSLVPTLLKATIFPRQAKDGFRLLRDNFGYTSSIHSVQAAPTPENKAELVVGKSGLVKFMIMTDDHENEERSYEYNIVENHVCPKHDKHPVNIDIAVLKYTDDSRHRVCSIEESFANLTAALGEDVSLPQLPQKITWSGPPGQTIEEHIGNVVYIENGIVHLLSDRLIKFNDPPQPGEYPGYVWPEPANHVPLGHSGAPVFLQSQNGTTFHLLGSLITRASASPVIFSLNMVHAELAIHHIDQILAARPSYLQGGITPDMIERLKTYKQYLTWHSKQQSLSPLMEERHIRCELNICIHPH